MSTSTEHSETPAPAAGESHAQHQHEHPSDAKYVQIAVILAAITAAEVATYYLDLNTTALLLVLMPMMIVKFAMVAMWFMHLKFDSPLFRRFFVTGIVLASVVYIVVLSTFRFFS